MALRQQRRPVPTRAAAPHPQVCRREHPHRRFRDGRETYLHRERQRLALVPLRPGPAEPRLLRSPEEPGAAEVAVAVAVAALRPPEGEAAIRPAAEVAPEAAARPLALLVTAVDCRWAARTESACPEIRDPLAASYL